MFRHALYNAALAKGGFIVLGGGGYCFHLGVTKISDQLYQVAKIIRTHTLRKAERDLFFVELGGWDHHSDVDGEKAATLWEEVDWAIEDFVNEMKAQNEFDNVVLATSSDFGRTLTSNGKGTDHGWAGNHLIVGGAIQGGRVYNTFPESLLEGNAQDAKRGRLVPKYPWESMMSPLASWMGVADEAKATVFPNLANFNSSHIISMTDIFTP